jgi:eukaryotic-like serine/threonine-protein kinase
VIELTDALRDRYTLVRELGRGGMATVYLARDLRHRRPVALKVLHHELAAMLGPERFLREIELTAGLQHPHILPLLDSGEVGGLLYYVMPYVEGESLRQRLHREGQLPLDDAYRLSREVAEALDYAHGNKIIHRDIKPENILLSRGHALVADFGIALAATQAGGGRLTETGLSLGTPAYMSPEQAMADSRLDGRSDQYSLACVLYEMLAGEPPYTGSTAQAIIAKRLSEPIPHVSTLREVPAGVERAVHRALSRTPADRFPSAGSFADALTAAPTKVHAGGASRRIRWWQAAVVLLVVCGVALMALFRDKSSDSVEPAVPRQRQQTFSGQASEPALAPDGHAIVYVRDRRSLVLELLNGGAPLTLTQAGAWIAWPRWSPDGQWVYFTMLPDGGSSAAIYRVPARGGTPTKLVNALSPVDLSPDGRVLVRGAGDFLFLHDAASGKEQRRLPIARARAQSDVDAVDVAWSPDGQWIASVRWQGDVVVTSVDGHRSLVVAKDRFGPVRWAPEGNALYYLSGTRGGADIVRAEFDPSRERMVGKERTSLSGIPSRRTGEAVFDVGRSGHNLAYMNGPESQHLWVFRLDAGSDTAVAQRLSKDSRAYDWPAVSHDGRMLAVMQHDLDHWDQGNYFLLPVAGGDFTPLTSGPGYKSNPGWAPDGRHLALVLTDSTGSRLVLMDRGGQQLSVGSTPPSPITFYRITWSSDSRTMLYPAKDGKALVALDVLQGVERLTLAPDSVGIWLGAVLSPDAKEIVTAQMRDPGGPYHIARGHVGGRDWSELQVPPGDNMPLIWRADGWIYLYNDRDGEVRGSWATRQPSIWRVRSDGSRRELVGRLPESCRFGFVSMSGDARRVACAVLHQEPDIWLVSNFGASP